MDLINLRQHHLSRVVISCMYTMIYHVIFCICTHILFCEKNALKAEEYKPILCTDCLMITKQINFHSYKNLLNPTVQVCKEALLDKNLSSLAPQFSRSLLSKGNWTLKDDCSQQSCAQCKCSNNFTKALGRRQWQQWRVPLKFNRRRLCLV